MKKERVTQLHLAYLHAISEIPRYQIALGVAALIIVFQLLAIVTILPLKETKVEYVAFANSEDVMFRVLPAPLNKEQKLLLVRQLLREYVYNRVHIDNLTERNRFAKVVAMSAKSVVVDFKKEYERIEQESSFTRRDVKIIADWVVDEAKNVHQIEFETTDHYKGQTYKNSWVVTLKYQFKKSVVKKSNELLNPLGLTVDHYFQAQKELTNEDFNELF